MNRNGSLFVPMKLDEAELARRVDGIVDRMSPDVVRIRYTVTENWDGDPAVYFRVVLSDQAAAGAARREAIRSVRAAVRDELNLAEWGYFPYFNFRGVTEQSEVGDPAWE